MKLDITKLQADVAAQKTVNASIVTLLATTTAALKSLSAQVASGGADTDGTTQAAIDSMATDLESSTSALTLAVTENTPAAEIGDHAMPAGAGEAENDKAATIVADAAEGGGATQDTTHADAAKAAVADAVAASTAS